MARGALLLVFGVIEGGLTLLAFRIPHVTTSTLVLLMGGFVVIDAVMTTVEVARAAERSWRLELRALSGAVAAALMLVLAVPSAVKIFAWWAIVTGVLDAADSRAAGPMRLVPAALSVALGLLLVTGAFRYPVHAVLTIAAYGVIAGAMHLGAARSGHAVGGWIAVR
jgi:hypothetical protein